MLSTVIESGSYFFIIYVARRDFLVPLGRFLTLDRRPVRKRIRKCVSFPFLLQNLHLLSEARAFKTPVISLLLNSS